MDDRPPAVADDHIVGRSHLEGRLVGRHATDPRAQTGHRQADDRFRAAAALVEDGGQDRGASPDRR